jgi:hypothetical protein
MKKYNVLVLGNDPTINQIDFSRLSPNIITLGVNRIWLKHIPNYFFFNDIPIAMEINKQPEILNKLKTESFCFSSDWLVKKSSAYVPDWTTVYSRLDSSSFPDSVTTAISIFSKDIMPHHNITYYIAGVSLKWMQPSHFWKELNYPSLNTHNASWYAPRFKAISQNFTKLKRSHIEMVSVTPNSMLNKIMRYENINNLYQ